MIKNNEKMTADLFVPADVPSVSRDNYVKNFMAITQGTGRLFMFAADQKIEHLNYDFYGAGIDRAANNPEHIFNIAEHSSIGALAIHAGLLARYGVAYNSINYIVKLNGKTNLIPTEKLDPISMQLWGIQDVIHVAHEHNICIRGVGYTVYLGSVYESDMLSQAAQLVVQAHRAGLIAVIWIYPRACHIEDETSPELIAGAAGLGNALGADFVKVHVPHAQNTMSSIQALKVATEAAGNTGVVCSGGEFIDAQNLLMNIHEQLIEGNASGCAIGRNIFQRSYADAVVLCKAIYAIVYDKAHYLEAKKILGNVR